jgi:N-acetylmuramoyl-L-alanine amidase
MNILDRPSPNHGPRPAGAGIDMLILHYTGMPSADAAIERLCTPEAQVSAHYVIDEDGTVWRLVPEERRAWHAGLSAWAGRRDINDRSIGIELVNPGHEFGYRDFPEAQMRSLETLCREVLRRHAIPPRHVLGHSDVAPQRKCDPGERFDWRRLARAGIGLWPNTSPGTAAPQTPAEIQRLLAAIGYETSQTGVFDAETRQVIVAFQRHYRPARLDGEADAETCRLITAVAAGI